MLSQRLCALQPFMESSNVFHDQSSISSKDGNKHSTSVLPNETCRSSINAGAATAALLSSQIRKRKTPVVTPSSTSVSQSQFSVTPDTEKTTPATSICVGESKKSKLLSAGDNQEEESSKSPIISPLQFLEGLFSSVTGGMETIRAVQVEHKNKMESRCSASPPQCDVNSYSVEMVRAVQSGDVSKLKDILKQQNQQQLKSVKDGDTNFVNVFNACNRFGESLLHMACRRGHYEIVKFLLQDAAVTIDRYDDYGRTPLHDAFWTTQPNFAIAELLIRTCSPHLLVSFDVRGHTPFHYARAEHHGAWTTFLRQHRSILMQRISLYLSTVSMTNVLPTAVPTTIAVQQKQLQIVKEEAKEQLLNSSNAKNTIAVPSSSTQETQLSSSATKKEAVKVDRTFVNPIAVSSTSLTTLIPGQIQGQPVGRITNFTPSTLTGMQNFVNTFPADQQKHLYSVLLQSTNAATPASSLQLVHMPISQSQPQVAVLLPSIATNNEMSNLNCAMFPMAQQQIHAGQAIAPLQNHLFHTNFLQPQPQTLPQMTTLLNTINLAAPTTSNQRLVQPPQVYRSNHPSMQQQLNPMF